MQQLRHPRLRRLHFDDPCNVSIPCATRGGEKGTRACTAPYLTPNSFGAHSSASFLPTTHFRPISTGPSIYIYIRVRKGPAGILIRFAVGHSIATSTLYYPRMIRPVARQCRLSNKRGATAMAGGRGRVASTARDDHTLAGRQRQLQRDAAARAFGGRDPPCPLSLVQQQRTPVVQRPAVVHRRPTCIQR